MHESTRRSLQLVAVYLLAALLWVVGFGDLTEALWPHDPTKPASRLIHEGLPIAVTGVLLFGFSLQARRKLALTRERVARFELLYESTPDVVLFATPEGRIVDGNEAASLAYGRARAELTGMSLEDLCVSACCPALARRAGSTAAGRYEASHRRADGTCFPVEVSAVQHRRGDERLALLIVRDISERHQRDAVRTLLHELDSRVLQGEPLATLLDFVARQVAELYGLELVQIGLRRPDGQVDLCSVGGPAADFARDLAVRWDDTPSGRGPTGTAIRTGRPVLIDVATDDGFAPWRERAERYSLRAGLALPLAARGETLGAMTIYSRHRRAFDDEARVGLRAFADQVALSLVAARVQQQNLIQRAALESAANAVLITDLDGRVEWVNPAFERLSGYEAAAVVGRTPAVLKSGVHAGGYYRHMWETILGGQVWRGETWNRHRDGTIYVEEQTITPVRNDEGRIGHFISIKQDVSERKHQEEQIRFLALHDPLTHLPNRRALNEHLERAVERARRGQPAALLLIDLDHFQAVNDTLGHPAGDRVLVAIAATLRTALRPTDLVARVGGDEFAVLLEGVDLAHAEHTAARLREAIDTSRYAIEERVFSLGLSIGIAPIDGAAADALALADSALYEAKVRGNRVVVHRRLEDGQARLAQSSEWAARVKDALREGRFCLHLQPIVRLADRRVAHFEALLRMRAEGDDLVYPDSFLGAAERFGLMPELDRWVVDEAIRLLLERPGDRIFVNLSGHSLGQGELLAHIESRLAASPALFGRLAFEITESAAVSDLAASQVWLRRLKDKGCLFALDDFGKGFSSFSYLRALSVDIVKIDGAFVHRLDSDATNRALVQAIKSLAQALGKEVVAEAVESEATARALFEMGIEYGQGYALGRPAPTSPTPYLVTLASSTITG